MSSRFVDINSDHYATGQQVARDILMEHGSDTAALFSHAAHVARLTHYADEVGAHDVYTVGRGCLDHLLDVLNLNEAP